MSRGVRWGLDLTACVRESVWGVLGVCVCMLRVMCWRANLSLPRVLRWCVRYARAWRAGGVQGQNAFMTWARRAGQFTEQPLKAEGEAGGEREGVCAKLYTTNKTRAYHHRNVRAGNEGEQDGAWPPTSAANLAAAETDHLAVSEAERVLLGDGEAVRS